MMAVIVPQYLQTELQRHEARTWLVEWSKALDQSARFQLALP